MTIEASSSGEERSRTCPSGQRLSHNQNNSNSEVDACQSGVCPKLSSASISAPLVKRHFTNPAFVDLEA